MRTMAAVDGKNSHCFSATSKKSTILLVTVYSGLISLFMIGLLFGCVQLSEHAWSFIAAYLMLMVIAVTIAQRVFSGQFIWFEPVNFVFLAMGIGFGFRGIYIALGYYDSPVGIARPEDFDYYVNMASWYGLLGMLVFLLGYSRVAYAEKAASHIPVYRPRLRRNVLYCVVFFYAAVGLLGLILLIRESGFSLASLALANLSMKRHDLESGGYAAATPELLTIAVLLLGIVYFTRKKTFLFWILFLLACVWPIYSSSRSSLFSIWLMVLVAYTFFRRRFPKKVIVTIGLIVILSSSAMVVVRGMHGTSSGTESAEGMAEKAFRSITDNLLGGSSLADVVVFAHILSAVEPGHQDLKYGSTYLTLFARPIPREWWRDKPVNLGNWVAIELYHRPHSYNERGAIQVAGIPPPMVAELYWNFHVAGIIAGMFLFGFLCRILYEYIKLNRSIAYTVIIYSLAATYVLKFTMADFSNVSTLFFLEMGLLLCPFYLISGGMIARPKSAKSVKTAPMRGKGTFITA